MQLILKACILTVLCKYSLAASDPKKAWVVAFSKMLLGDKPIVGIEGANPPNYTHLVFQKMREYGILKKLIRKGSQVKIRAGRKSGYTGVVVQRVPGQPCHVRVHEYGTHYFLHNGDYQLKKDERKLELLPPYYRLRPQDAADAQLFCQDAYFFEHDCTYGRDGARLDEPEKVIGFYYRLNNGKEIILPRATDISRWRESPKHKQLRIRYGKKQNKSLSKYFRCDSTLYAHAGQKLFKELVNQLGALGRFKMNEYIEVNYKGKGIWHNALYKGQYQKWELEKDYVTVVLLDGCNKPVKTVKVVIDHVRPNEERRKDEAAQAGISEEHRRWMERKTEAPKRYYKVVKWTGTGGPYTFILECTGFWKGGTYIRCRGGHTHC